MFISIHRGERINVFHNNLRRIFRTKTDEIKGRWKQLNYEALHKFYYSTSIMTVIKLRTIRWVGRVKCMGRRKMYTKF